MEGPRTQARQRLLWLGRMEAANVLFVPAVVVYALWSFERRLPSVVVWAGLLPMLWLLVQGSTYWLWKAESIEGRDGPFPAARFRSLERSNPVILFVSAVVVAVFFRRPDAWLGVLAWAMAVLEHINYYKVQLMHDTAADWRRLMRDRRLRPSALAKDMRRTGNQSL